MTPRVKVRYFGGTYDNPNKAHCTSCGGGSNSRIRMMNEAIQFRSDMSPTGLRTQTFQVGRDYFVSEFEAEELCKMTFVNLNGVTQNKFRIIED